MRFRKNRENSNKFLAIRYVLHKCILCLPIVVLIFFAASAMVWRNEMGGIADTNKKLEQQAPQEAKDSSEKTTLQKKDVLHDDMCSGESLYENPLNFGQCIREDVSPSCKPRQTENWDKWVGDRYKKYDGKCVTPQLMNETGEEWAISGRGSTLAATVEIRKLLVEIFADPSLNIRTFFDCPCGDWLWMQIVDLSSVQYFGGDITKETIKENTRCFERSNVHFRHLDWSCAIPPPVDLLMLRDVLFHLSTSVVLDILRHVNQSGAKYLLSTTFPNKTNAKTDNYEAEGVGYRDINLYGPPYNFPEPIMKTGEEARGGRHMALWKLPIPVQ